MYIMWFDELRNKNVVGTYEVHNDAYKYDEEYSEAPSEFFVSLPNSSGGVALSYAQESIMSAIIQKLKSCFNATKYIDENYGDSYNDCGYNEVYSED